MNAELIYVTILDGGGICFQNGDELKRLVEVGILRSKAPAEKARVGRAKFGLGNEYVISRLGGGRVRGLAHYRKLVGNPRTNGPLHRYQPGMTLTMELCQHPKHPAAKWYVIVDTAIGGAIPFIRELESRGRIRIDSPSS